MHFALFFALNQVVLILHADEARPAVQIGGIQRLGELPGVHRGGADVTRLTGFHHVVQRFQRLFQRRFVIPAVDLQQIDIVGARRRRLSSMDCMMLARDKPRFRLLSGKYTLVATTTSSRRA